VITELSGLFIQGIEGGLLVGIVAGGVGYAFFMLARMFQAISS
jgi:hypothetical protein